MMPNARVAILLIAVLTLVYVCVYFYLREGRKMRLEEEWVQEGRPGQREPWVAERLKPEADRILRWLILPVYGIPIAVIAVILFVSS